MTNFTVAEFTRQPYALTLSSGFFGFFAHAAFCESLVNHGDMPKQITGSSAGALIGSMLACGLSPDEIKEHLFSLNKARFWDPGLGLGWLKGRKFREILREILGDRSFSETSIPYAVSAFQVSTKQTVVLNSGDLIEAVYASCAVPFMFQPAKINGKRLLDGGVKDRPGIAGARDDLPVLYHHIHSKSAWRKSVPLPTRGNVCLVTMPHLPRSGPNKLNLGPEIYDQALQRSNSLWQRKIEDQLYI
jgi:NTE family protein